jgi:NADP-dependent 3-hydroxy acid dehydrogenase YdfG
VAGLALVTGAGRGIGEVVATRLTADGWRVAIAARNPDDLARVADATGATALPLDVTDAAAVASAVDPLGPVDLLVNNAGTAGAGVVDMGEGPGRLVACLRGERARRVSLRPRGAAGNV